MRPDQHKKKKNAVYKKKHGIQSQEKNKNTNQSDQNNSNSGPRSEKPDVDNSLNLEEHVESENEQSFSKRQIGSNWDRYRDDQADLDTDVDFNLTPTKIGSDFQTLLDKKGGPSSHFHFQSEKEWDDISENDEVEANPLSIDFKSLAQALKNIPLQERFEIDRKYFEDKHLQGNANTSSLGDHNTLTLSTNGYLATQAKTEQLKQTFSPNFSTPDKLSQSKSYSYKLSEATVQVFSSNVQEDIKIINDVQNTCRKPVVNEDDFLDSLLGMETKEISKPVHDQDSIPNVLVTNDSTGSETDTVPKPPQDTKENLEDWLDSILD